MNFLTWSGILTALLAVFSASASALQLDVNSTQSLKDAATTTAVNLFCNSTISGAVNPVYGDDDQAFNASVLEAWLYSILIPFWNATGNDTYNDMIRTRLYSKIDTELSTSWVDDGNGDSNINHAAWALAAVTAAEFGFPGNTSTQWEVLAGNAAGTMQSLWAFAQTCSGGLIFSQQNTSFKDAFSNGEYFQLSSRLAYLTHGNDQGTYSTSAATVWDWSVTNQLVNETDWTMNFVTMNSTNGQNCTAGPNQMLWTYQYGLYMSGAAYMYEVTGIKEWKTRAEGLLNKSIELFFKKRVMVEGGWILGNSAEVGGYYIDDNTEYSFRGLFITCLVSVARLIPETVDTIVPLLETTAKAAAKQCSGTANSTVCGSDWTDPVYDLNPSFFTSMSALSLFTANLRLDRTAGNKTTTNGTSTSGSTSGSSSGSGSGSSSLSGGDIAGIVVGSVAGVALIAAAAFFIWRKMKKQPAQPVAEEQKPVTDNTTDSKGKFPSAELDQQAASVAELAPGGGAYNYPEMDGGPLPENVAQELPATRTIRYELDAS
ncbi:hypothetical protein BO70DRAFT_366148 [Aspergillus heteromorphus CBS 117.55]|uniref:mannan endo-1,6-alpha-mannosidase n=1 Tax=Aspergillus heteromorphus CBS 117.55 TaxID=1448321 RepID=A0A317V2H2_9EURO|nr:uncharacterized protein BO70DRAFT_366148 [Aspergillus heteromorphus CBS 117.55]PWY68483.1 hypothetical protein BO70DRAFT_366148 [Aspergillus heteromorphus CBS 117.55]